MPTIKNPAAPASDAQIGFIATLQEERGLPVGVKDGLTKGEASEMIGALQSLPKAGAKPAAPKPSLSELAAQISGQAAPVAAPAPAVEPVGIEQIAAPKPEFTDAELAHLSSALSCYIGETDGTAMSYDLAERIDSYLAKPAVAPKATAKTGEHTLPEGHYAVTGNDGTTDFYRVEYGKAGGKWEGFLFLSRQVSDDYTAVKGTAKGTILAKIEADPMGAATRYGQELGVCGICHKTLTDPESIAAGIGPVCATKFGV